MKKRVWALYRVSTMKQVGENDDIPQQETEVRRMIGSRTDWELKKEWYERGVSGFKKKLKDRDVIQNIIRAAEDNEFDILAVFAHDRIGRNKDEIPPQISYLIRLCGVEIWSATEGEIQAKTHTDDLINFIHFWKAEGESKKISERVTPSIRRINEEGKYSGGRAPYGYEVYSTGKKHFKYDKIMKDIRINEKEMEVVKLMFEIADSKGYGCARIADYLNERGYRNRSGKLWRFNVIFRMLQNPIYKGHKRYHTVRDETSTLLPKEEWILQPYNEALQGIDTDLWERVNEQIDERSVTRNNPVHGSFAQRGKLLCNGLAYCGYCGYKLNSHHSFSTYTKKSGEKSQYKLYRYKCPDSYVDREKHEVTVFSAKKYEKQVEDTVKDFIQRIDLSDVTDKIQKNKNRDLERREKEILKLKESEAKINKSLGILNDEVVRVLLGESKFTEETLTKAIEKSERDLSEVKSKISDMQRELDSLIARTNDVDIFKKDIVNWVEKYDKGSLDEKKVLLSKITSKVFFRKDEIEIVFKYDLETLGISV